MNKKIFLGLTLFSLTSFGVLTACGKKESLKSEQKEIIIATNANSKPNTYMVDDKLTGFDVELARTVFKQLPEYKIKFQVIDFNSVLSGVDNGRFQMAANALSWTPERAEKYNYSLPLSKSATSVAVKPDLKVKTLYDLAGKTTEVLPGVQVATMLETCKIFRCKFICTLKAKAWKNSSTNSVSKFPKVGFVNSASKTRYERPDKSRLAMIVKFTVNR